MENIYFCHKKKCENSLHIYFCHKKSVKILCNKYRVFSGKNIYYKYINFLWKKYSLYFLMEKIFAKYFSLGKHFLTKKLNFQWKIFFLPLESVFVTKSHFVTIIFWVGQNLISPLILTGEISTFSGKIFPAKCLFLFSVCGSYTLIKSQRCGHRSCFYEERGTSMSFWNHRLQDQS